MLHRGSEKAELLPGPSRGESSHALKDCLPLGDPAQVLHRPAAGAIQPSPGLSAVAVS